MTWNGPYPWRGPPGPPGPPGEDGGGDERPFVHTQPFPPPPGYPANRTYLTSIAGILIWRPIDLSDINALTNVLLSVSGGTGYAVYDDGDLLLGDSSGGLVKLNVGLPGQVLTALPTLLPGELRVGWADLPAGAPGMRGEDGEDAPWLPGPQGNPGAAGATGATGPTGPAGAMGPPRAQGEDSHFDGALVPGPQGNAGATGATGATGAAGAQGVMGPPGMPGEDAEETAASRPPGLSGILPLAQGGSGADLSAAGPGVLRQAAAGAAVTCGQALDFIHCREEQTAGTNGGTFTSGAWQTRVLNTEVADTGNNLSLASNQMTLSAGTYRIIAVAPATSVAAHQLRLQNVTDGTTVLLGVSHYADPTANGSANAVLYGRFTVAAGKALELQHRCGTTKTTNGFGVPLGVTTEVYATVTLWKEVG